MHAKGKSARGIGQPLVVLCLMGAALLAAAALLSGNQAAEEQWIPLNAEVAAALGDEDKAASDIAVSGHIEGDVDFGIAAPGDNGERAVPDTDASQANANSLGEGNSKEANINIHEDASMPEAEGKLDVNRATAEQLDELKGIGPSKAQAIVEERERGGFFASVDDLQRVKGIGEKLVAKIKDSVVARP
ncbi:ComEA family DNA-binding protein [Paenibacillus sp. HB172176]|uniref:ComEA family DNA-binding protein n=1 Tax=Paenibacillus sp. HB172176 TaxID=2493690 RepID=UPI00143965C6|nr:ComEA family DNA-binding protein [Paenibacillus sp. HB172176]